MGTREWLRKYGLVARKLELFDVLSGVAFKHQDGVLELKVKPEKNEHTDAVSDLCCRGDWLCLYTAYYQSWVYVSKWWDVDYSSEIYGSLWF